MKPAARIFLFCSIGLFLASLVLPAFCYKQFEGKGGGCESVGPGIFLLLFGWLDVLFMGAATGGAGLTWIANPLLMLAWTTFKYPKVSIWFSTFAVIFSASFLFFTQIIVTEAGHYRPICHWLPGYWFWLFSTIMMVVRNGIQIGIQMNIICSEPPENVPILSKNVVFNKRRIRQENDDVT